MTQISNMKVISLMVDFLKIVKLWHLSTEFYGVWEKVALCHGLILAPKGIRGVYTAALN